MRPLLVVTSAESLAKARAVIGSVQTKAIATVVSPAPYTTGESASTPDSERCNTWRR